MNKSKIIIAIDGPAGAGKSTIAKRIAKELNIDYIDTGAMYRAFALKLSRTGTDYKDADALAVLLENTDVDFDLGKTLLDGEDVSGLIRTPEISALASSSSAVKEIRVKLVALQQAMGERKSIVMDGRDIGTVVFPDADIKFYLTASVEERAKRRALEYEEKGIEADFEQIKKDIAARDYQDMNRENSPLKKAEDAIEVDSSDLNIDETVAELMKHIEAL